MAFRRAFHRVCPRKALERPDIADATRLAAEERVNGHRGKAKVKLTSKTALRLSTCTSPTMYASLTGDKRLDTQGERVSRFDAHTQGPENCLGVSTRVPREGNKMNTYKRIRVQKSSLVTLRWTSLQSFVREPKWNTPSESEMVR